MKKVFLVLLFITQIIHSQKNLDALLKKHNSESVPYILVDSLSNISDKEIILLDAREKNEFTISHLKGAKFVGYSNFNLKKTVKNLPNKNAKIVVYCSLGIRSEDIAEKLKQAGYNNVLNLYGGIFEWKNKNNKVYNYKEKETEKVHAFSKEWETWLLKGEKIY